MTIQALRLSYWVIAIVMCAAVVRGAHGQAFREISLDQALTVGGSKDRLVMVDFFTESCAPCKKMDVTTWSDPGVVDWLANNVVAIRVNANEKPHIAKKYRVTSYPLMLFLDSSGVRVEFLSGYLGPQEFIQEAQRAISGSGPLSEARQVAERLERGTLQDVEKWMEIVLLAQDIQRYGGYEESLRILRRAWGGVESSIVLGPRLSYLPGVLAGLGDEYPPAMDYMNEQCEQRSRSLVEGRGTVLEASELAALNYALDAAASTLAVLDSLSSSYEAKPEDLAQIRQLLSRHAAEPLAAAGRYKDLVAWAGDVLGSMKNGISSPSDVEFWLSYTGGAYYEALLGVGDVDRANELSEVLLRHSAKYSVYEALVRRAARGKHQRVVKELLHEARRDLSETEMRRLEDASTAPADRE